MKLKDTADRSDAVAALGKKQLEKVIGGQGNPEGTSNSSPSRMAMTKYCSFCKRDTLAVRDESSGGYICKNCRNPV